MATHPHGISTHHYAGFGMIINTVAELDALLDGIISQMIKCNAWTLAPLLQMLRSKDKTDYIIAMAKESTLPPFAVHGLEKLMDGVVSAHDLRNKVAHCSWRPGSRAGTIKPLNISARKTLKIVGRKKNEKEWTGADLVKEAQKFQVLGQRLVVFMNRYGLMPLGDGRP